MNVSNALTVQNDLIYNGSRVFIPITCRKQVIDKFHDVHQGINALKNLVENNAWWPFMDNDIEQFVKNCPAYRSIYFPQKIKNNIHAV